MKATSPAARKSVPNKKPRYWLAGLSALLCCSSGPASPRRIPGRAFWNQSRQLPRTGPGLTSTRSGKSSTKTETVKLTPPMKPLMNPMLLANRTRLPMPPVMMKPMRVQMAVTIKMTVNLKATARKMPRTMPISIMIAMETLMGNMTWMKVRHPILRASAAQTALPVIVLRRSPGSGF